MIDRFLSVIAENIGESLWLAPLLAFVAGALTSFTPCSLTSVPLVIGYVGGSGEKSAKRAFVYSVAFAFGAAVAFVALGVCAVTLGRLMGTASNAWYLFLGVLMTLMALQTWEIANFIPTTNFIAKNKRRGVIGAFFAGVLGGIFSSPCATPVLIALLAIVADNGSFLWGILLMTLYSLGHSLLAIAAGTSVGFVQRVSSSGRYQTAAAALKTVMGTVILLIGFYMFYLAF